MRPAEPISLTLAVGDPVRAAVGRAVRGSLLLAATFVVFAWAAKELPSLYARAPWQDDPYDALISFTIFAVPLLAGLCLVRAPLCRRREPLPVRRALDLARAGQLLVGAVLVTTASEWVSVALGDRRSAWTAVTIVLIGMLSLVSVLSGAVAAQLWRARRNLPADSRLLAQPDWLADAAVTGERLAARLGRRHQAAADTLRRLERAMLAGIARHLSGRPQSRRWGSACSCLSLRRAEKATGRAPPSCSWASRSPACSPSSSRREPTCIWPARATAAPAVSCGPWLQPARACRSPSRSETPWCQRSACRPVIHCLPCPGSWSWSRLRLAWRLSRLSPPAGIWLRHAAGTHAQMAAHSAGPPARHHVCALVRRLGRNAKVRCSPCRRRSGRAGRAPRRGEPPGSGHPPRPCPVAVHPDVIRAQ
jgi:hypothetical protein